MAGRPALLPARDHGAHRRRRRAEEVIPTLLHGELRDQARGRRAVTPRRWDLTATGRILPLHRRLDSRMDGRHTRGSYLTRIELALRIGAVLFACSATTYDPMLIAPIHQPRPVGLADMIVPAGFVAMLVGLALMIRIFRGPRDEPPRWRYRDR